MEKNLDPGSKILGSGKNIQDPQHCVRLLCVRTAMRMMKPYLSRRGFLDESAVVGGDIPVVGVLLQHVDLQLDLLLLILCHVHH